MSYSIEQARRDLGRRLRELRDSAGLTGTQLAERLTWSQPKVSKFETGRQVPNAAEITVWARACGQADAAEGLIERLNDLESMWVEWKRQVSGGLGGIQSRMADEEEHVGLFRVFESVIIPGLLQTPDYARAVLESVNRKNGTSIGVDDAVGQRMRRQEILYRRDKRFCFLIGEAAVRQRRGDRDVMAGQLDRLIAASGLSTVSLGIVPFDTDPAYIPLHGFWIQDEESVVIETVSAELTLTHRNEVEQYLHVFQMTASAARFNGDARSLLNRISKESTG
ncbi:helix-turn-helix domain-containing protein [Salinactinospora qingdaonensis]|uniref:Helix-turn-helix transcriptional regulator n=1 Tax=Salinactinospora qingdaonensis TaxID=702744 RepID=A0ABP7G471_9ACTN